MQRLTDKGAHAAQQGDPERREAFERIVSGSEDIGDYTTGICYDTVGFAWFLAGRATLDDLQDKGGQGWLDVFNFDGGTLWKGEDIPAGSAVGFLRDKQDPGYFHAALGCGGTTIRGVNGFLLGAGWSEPVNLKDVLTPDEEGVCEYDGTTIQVRYQPI